MGKDKVKKDKLKELSQKQNSTFKITKLYHDVNGKMIVYYEGELPEGEENIFFE